jgi:hypothetical protein
LRRTEQASTTVWMVLGLLTGIIFEDKGEFGDEYE